MFDRLRARVRRVVAPRGMVGRVSLWIGLSTAVSLLAFGAVAHMVVVTQETEEGDQPDPAVIDEEAGTEVGGAMLLAAPVGLVLAVLGAVLITRRTIRPLRDVIVATGRMTPSDLSTRLPVPERDDEIRTLVLTLNALIARLESGYAALGRFAAEASHELRTPLAVIGTELEVMLHQPRTPEDWATSARTCLDEVHQVSRLVEALMVLSRAEGGAPPPGEPVGVPALLDRVASDLSPRARQRGVGLLRHDPPGPVEDTFIRGEVLALASALANLVDNALRYTPTGGEVQVSWCPGDSGTVCVRVDDSGPGVDPDEVERIFEPFFRGRASRPAPGASESGARTGCGLGLTIARRVFALHQATVSVGRSPLGGARFEVRFAPLSA